MKPALLSLCALLLLTIGSAAAVAAEQTSDLRRAVPTDAFLAVYSKHNPERDSQRRYLQEVYNEVRETQIIEQVMKIVTSHVPDEKLQKARGFLDEVKNALAPVDLDALVNCEESVYAQMMDQRSSQHLVLLRLTPEAAGGCEQAIINLFHLIQEKSEDQVTVNTSDEGSVKLTGLTAPGEVPLHPMVARVDDVLLVSTSPELARASLAMLRGDGGPSKFDDPRLKEALAQLPVPEDSITFYDGRTQFDQLRKMVEQVSSQHAGQDKERWVSLTRSIFDEVAVIDYEVTVAYTEGRRNLCQTLGKLLPGVENTLLGKTFGSGESFENWQRWVPSDASTYSLSMGANLHPLYEYVVHLIEHQIPEAQDALKQFDDLQKQYDVSLDRDILQAFSGESVSVTLPAAQPTLLAAQDSVLAMRCHKPERIRELLHRVVEHLQQLPFIESQQLELEESTELDGFEELSANVFSMFGARPVIGFHNGWMIWASNAGAAKKVLETLAGNGQTILESDAYKAFELDVSGPVQSISYTDLAQRTRQAAMMLNQAGAIVPAVIGMAGAQADGDAEKLQTVQDLVALLPSVAKIVAKFDYLEANLSVTQKGERPDTYQRRGVTLVRAPE